MTLVGTEPGSLARKERKRERQLEPVLRRGWIYLLLFS